MPEVGARINADRDVFSKASDIFFHNIFPVASYYRPEKTQLLEGEEIVDFNKLRNDPYFLKGIERTETACEKEFTLCLMCCEKNPVDCHRYFLIGKTLNEKFGDWLEVLHIIRDNSGISATSNTELDNRLRDYILNKQEIRKLKLYNNSMDLFEYTENPISSIDNYCGNNLSEKINDFCDRYWNIMHGWKKTRNSR
ncbi:MAG: hypothetical protein IJ523_11150 [Succinivibrionaceae bacterium]|nr:hypothetical protein [Succinivibrionaceae bacterium]